MQYRYRVSAKGRLILSRSSRRYAISAAFLSLGLVCAATGAALLVRPGTAPSVPALLPIASAAMALSFSLLTLFNRGAPRRMTIDQGGLRMSIGRRRLRIPRADIAGIWARKTVSVTLGDSGRRAAILWKTMIALKSGTAIPLFEGASRMRAEALARACEEALAKGRPAIRREGHEQSEPEAPPSYSIMRTEEGCLVSVPLRASVPGFLMAAGMLGGSGAILFGILPGSTPGVILALLMTIWALLALVMVAAFIFALFGKQRLVVGPRTVEAQRGIFGISFPPASLERSQAAATYLDLEDNSLSIISRDLKRELDAKSGLLRDNPNQDPDQEAARETMAIFLSGRIVRLDVSALNWIERFALEADVRTLLAEEPGA